MPTKSKTEMITIPRVDESMPGHPIVLLSEVPSAAWREALEAYLEAWPLQSEIVLAGSEIRISLLPAGTTYADLGSFVNKAVSHANDICSTAVRR